MPKKKGHGSSSNSSKKQKRSHREEKATLRRERRAARARLTDAEFVSFNGQLQTQGLCLKDVPGDGNCLFRALSDQLDGGRTRHSDLRQQVVRYICSRRDEFEPFLDEEEPYDEYVAELSKDGVFAGNDAIVAFARQNGVDIVIHQLDAPNWEVRGAGPVPRALHIAYLHGEHYCSVRPVDDMGRGTPSLPGARSQPMRLQDSVKQSGQFKLPGNQSPDDPELHALMALADCKDVALAQQCLLDCGYDLDLALPQLLQLMEITSVPLAGGGSGHTVPLARGGSGHEGQKLTKKAGGDPDPLDHQPYLSSKKRKQQARQERRESGPVQRGAGPVQRGVGGAEGLEERIGAMSI